MADQYMSLAHALYDYGDKIAKKIQSRDDDGCDAEDLEDIQDLIDRGYRYIGVKAGNNSTVEIEDSSSKPEFINTSDDHLDETPFQTMPGDTCTDPEKLEEDPYGWTFEETYFYSEKFNFFGAEFGKNVYFESMGINTYNSNPPSDGELEVYIDGTELEEYNYGDDHTIIVNTAGDPIIEFNGQDITCYVDVHFKGSSDCAKIKGDGVSTMEISVDKNFNNNYEGGGSC